MCNIIKYNNKFWDTTFTPLISVITPFYNRANVIDRALNSVVQQTYRDFEYIIVDDGSVDVCDDKIFKYMNSVDFPCLFIKKQNGGVHTARNCGIKESRGKYIIFIDSDDELLPKALESFMKVWHEIEGSQHEYFEVKMRCVNQNGVELGAKFPNGINELPYKQALKIYENIKGEHIGMRSGDILRKNLWPEPKGVKFVTEDILWCKLRSKYSAYFSNHIARVYYTDSSDSLDRRKNNNEQSLINTLWNIIYMLNDWKVFKNKYGNQYFKYVLLHDILTIFLRKKRNKFEYLGLKNFRDKIVAVAFLVPAIVIKPIYYYRSKFLRYENKKGI